MKKLILFSGLFPLLAIASSYSCSQGNSHVSDKNPIGDTSVNGLPPVETQPANSPEHKPAFEGQTRIAGVKTNTPIDVQIIATDLGKPWGITNLPDNRFLITDNSGFMQIRSQDGQQLSKITGFPKVDDRGQGGMFAVALDPDFAQNKTIYWTYSERKGDENLTAVAKGVLSDDEKTIQNPVVIFRTLPYFKSTLHFGGRLLFDKDGYLFVSMGERSEIGGRMQAQNLKSGLGKIFKITKEGKPAPGNPFLNRSDAMPEIYSYGQRNPQGLDIHPVSGELWESEMGPQGGDEINIIHAGKDYGWPTITYGIEYSGGKVGAGITQKEGMEQPIYYWDPSKTSSPSGIAFYASDVIPEWKNNLFVGMLSGQHIARLVIKDNKVVGEERLLTDKNERIRDLVESNGALYAISDSGKLIKIAKK